MSISFNSVPSNLRVPFVAAEFDNSRASQGPALMSYRALVIGQKTAAGSASANTVHKVTNIEQVIALAGQGSMLHRQMLAWFDANTSTEVWIGVLEDNGAGVAAAGEFDFTAPPTADGTIDLYLGGVHVPVATTAGDVTVSTDVIAAINANLDLPVTASQGAGGKVAITFRHKGLVGNEYDLRVNYRDGEELPTGLAVTVTQPTSGTTNPVLTTLITAMGDRWFNIIAHPYTDATSLTAIENELASRFGPLRMIDGVAFTAKSATHSNLTTLGDGRNSPHSVIVGTNDSPTPPMEYAAHVAGVAAYYANIDPARPFQTLPLPYVLAPAEADRYTLEERNLLLLDGISTTKVAAGDQVQIERLITTFQENAGGSPDTSYLDVTTMLTLMYLRFSFRALISSRYPRHKLASDGTRFGAGQAVMTPKIMKAEAVLWFRSMEELGLVEGFDQFKQDLVVERNALDVNRLDVLLPPDLINSLIVTATSIQFRL